MTMKGTRLVVRSAMCAASQVHGGEGNRILLLHLNKSADDKKSMEIFPGGRVKMGLPLHVD